MGTADDGSPLTVAIQGRNILVVGEPQSGKSWATGLACEQMILQGYSVCVIDPEGDYGSLESLPGVVVLGRAEPLPDIPDVARALRHFDLSVVVDLSRASSEEKASYLQELMPMLVSLRQTTGLPHRIVVDEAHYFLRQPNVRDLLDLKLGAYTVVTYRPSDLAPDLLKGIDVVVAKRLTQPQEVQSLLAMVKDRGVEPQWTATLAALANNEAALLPGSEEAEGELRRFKLFPRLTQHVRHKTKYFDLQLGSRGRIRIYGSRKNAWAFCPIFEAVCIPARKYAGLVPGRTRTPRGFLPMDRGCVPRSSPGIRHSKNRTSVSHRRSGRCT